MWGGGKNGFYIDEISLSDDKTSVSLESKDEILNAVGYMLLYAKSVSIFSAQLPEEIYTKIEQIFRFAHVVNVTHILAAGQDEQQLSDLFLNLLPVLFGQASCKMRMLKRADIEKPTMSGCFWYLLTDGAVVTFDTACSRGVYSSDQAYVDYFKKDFLQMYEKSREFCKAYDVPEGCFDGLLENSVCTNSKTGMRIFVHDEEQGEYIGIKNVYRPERIIFLEMPDLAVSLKEMMLYSHTDEREVE